MAAGPQTVPAEAASAPPRALAADVRAPSRSTLLLGVRAALDGVTFTLREPALRKLAVAPALLQAVLVLVGFVLVMPWLYQRLAPETGGLLGVLAAVGAGLLSAAAVLVGALIASSVLGDPLYDAIAEEAERLSTGVRPAERQPLARVVAGVLRELAATAVRLAVWAAVATPLWLLSFTGVGLFVAVPLLAAWSAAFIAFDAVGRSQARHGAGPVERMRALMRSPLSALGFGGTALVLMLVPFTMPLVVVGGTRLFLRLAAADALPSTFSLETKALLRKRLS